MAIKTACPKCTQTLQVADDNAGKSVRCPMCQEVFQAAVLAEVVPEVAPAAFAPVGMLEAPIVVRTAEDYGEPTPQPPSVKKGRRFDREEDAQRRPGRVRAAGWSAAAIWLFILVPVALLSLAGAGFLLVLLMNVKGLEAKALDNQVRAEEARLVAMQEQARAQQQLAEAEQRRALAEKAGGDQARRQIEDLLLTNKNLEQELGAALQRNREFEAALAKLQKQPNFPLPPDLVKPPPKDKKPALAKLAGRYKPVLFKPHVPKSGSEEVELSGKVSDVAVGGGGRYLILHLAQQKKLAVFDVQLGKVARELPVADDVLLYAAGAEQLVCIYPNSRLLQLWSLATFEKERSSQLPDNLTRDDIHQICMGCASTGPLFIYLPKEKRTLALDLASLDTLEIHWNHWSPTNAYGPMHMRASQDGTMLLGWSGGWAGADMALFKDGRQLGAYDKFAVSLPIFILPSADGRFIYTPGGIYTREMARANAPELAGNIYMVPAHEPGYFLALRSQRSLPNTPYGKNAAANLPPVDLVTVFNDDRKALFTVDNCDELKKDSALFWERRIHYYPRAGLLITLANSNRLLLRRLNLIEELDKSGKDYLLVLSSPPTGKRGQAFSYRLDIRSKRGAAKTKLESGPENLKVAADGQISWSIPADFDEPEASVLVSIGDASGQEVFHQFRIAIEEK